MNSTANVALNVIGTGLIAFGVNTVINGNLWTGVVEAVLGVVVYIVYELVPTK